MKQTWQYVGFWARLGASFIDGVLLMLVLMPIFYLLYGGQFWGKSLEFTFINNLINYLLPFIGVLWLWMAKGATPGKMFIGATIVDAETLSKPTLKQFFIRNIAYIISLIPFALGYFWAGWDDKKQAWHDKLAHTVVIQDVKETKKISWFGYVGRALGVFLLLIFFVLMIFGFMLEGGLVPDGDIMKKEDITAAVRQELLDKHIVKDIEKLRYFQSDGMFEYTDSGVIITTEGLQNFSTFDGEIESYTIDFKDIEHLLVRTDDMVSSDVMDIAMVEIDASTPEGGEAFFTLVSMKHEVQEAFKQEVLALWHAQRDKHK